MSSGFVTEGEIAEARQKRQEEWEKVRKADDPLEAPDQPYDSRSLYDRLQEQKQKRDLEYEEAHKLKNMIKGLDDDEIEFLDLVDRTKLAADRKKTLEEEKELNDYRNCVVNLLEKSLDQKLQAEVSVVKPKTASGTRSSQTKLLKGAIVVKNNKRKASNSDSMEGKSDDRAEPNAKQIRLEQQAKDTTSEANTSEKNAEKQPSVEIHADNTEAGGKVLTCIGILPGLGYYTESSSDEQSSDSDEDQLRQTSIQYDLVGRKVILKEKDT